MKIFPAIDLKENKCVRLTKGKDDTSVVFNSNPIDQAKFFEDQGCSRLHLVDLDSAFGRNNVNDKTIESIRNAISIPIQIGGGIKSEKIAQNYIDLGVNYLIIGSFAITEKKVVKNIAQKHPDSIYVSLDILKNKIMIRGWREESNTTSDMLFKIYNKSMIRGYVLTDIENDGMLSGLNQEMIIQNLKLTNKKLIVGGGLKDNSDLEELIKIQYKNLEAVIAGKSFYVGNIDLKKAQQILSQNA
jgi:phosphoribosylformimino-5-aminoimidazole carboxamide ribotide isomerase